MSKAEKTRASKRKYISQNQQVIEGFESPFEQKLVSKNRWILLANNLPWDVLASVYNKQMKNQFMGASSINARVVIGAIMIKHLLKLSDEEVIQQIQENMYLQYFIGYSSFSTEAPFDASLFVTIRNRLGHGVIAELNEKIVLPPGVVFEKPSEIAIKEQNRDDGGQEAQVEVTDQAIENDAPSNADKIAVNNGSLLMDATVAPQNIKYPTDLELLNEAREKTDELIDHLNGLLPAIKRPRTHRVKAQRDFLQTAKKKSKSGNEIRRANKKQLQYLARNHKAIDRILDGNKEIRFSTKQLKYYFVTKTLYAQQLQMYVEKSHQVDDRIVSLHQPHVRPMVRGKASARTEFGAKLQVSLVNGYTFLDGLSWNAFNEGTSLDQSVENYKKRFGFYPAEVLADKIYCTLKNRSYLKEKGIRLMAKPLGRPSAVPIHIRPGARNPIEGKFGQAKTAYGLDKIKAKLKNTSESWIASILLVLNLVKLAGAVPYCLFSIEIRIHKCLNSLIYQKHINYYRFSALPFFKLIQ